MDDYIRGFTEFFFLLKKILLRRRIFAFFSVLRLCMFVLIIFEFFSETLIKIF